MTVRATRCTCSEDAKFLRSRRPAYEELPRRVRVVDLFSGCGGFSLGIAEAARRLGRGIDVRLALDSDLDAVQVYQANFPRAHVKRGVVEDLFDGRLGSKPTKRERQVAEALGSVDVLLGGPPCQGHSNLNNHTRRDDERNDLYARMARAAEVLRPTIVLVENVPAVLYDVEGIVQVTMKALRKAEYEVAEPAAVGGSAASTSPRDSRHRTTLYRPAPGARHAWAALCSASETERAVGDRGSRRSKERRAHRRKTSCTPQIGI